MTQIFQMCFCFLKCSLRPAEGDMRQQIVQAAAAVAAPRLACSLHGNVFIHSVTTQCAARSLPSVSQQDLRRQDQDDQGLPGRCGQLHPAPPSHAPLRLPCDRPAALHACPSRLHADSDCGGQSDGRRRTVRSHVPGNRWDASWWPLVISILTNRWQ